MTDSIRILLCGDVMLGRGIDQILPFPGEPAPFEAHAASALDHVSLARRATGPIARPADFSCVWGDARAERARAHLFIVNLETSAPASTYRNRKRSTTA